jgi:hypothetical protein
VQVFEREIRAKLGETMTRQLPVVIGLSQPELFGGQG